MEITKAIQIILREIQKHTMNDFPIEYFIVSLITCLKGNQLNEARASKWREYFL